MSVSMYICVIHNPGVQGRFYGLDLKKGNGHLGKYAMEVTRLMMKKRTADSKSKGKNTGYTCDLHGQ